MNSLQRHRLAHNPSGIEVRFSRGVGASPDSTAAPVVTSATQPAPADAAAGFSALGGGDGPMILAVAGTLGALGGLYWYTR